MTDDPKDDEVPYDPYSAFADAQISGAVAMHEQIIQQVSELLAGTDLSEEQKQTILASISCPCWRKRMRSPRRPRRSAPASCG